MKGRGGDQLEWKKVPARVKSVSQNFLADRGSRVVVDGGAGNEAMTRIYPLPGMYFIRRLSRDSLSLSGSIYLGSRGARRMRKF